MEQPSPRILKAYDAFVDEAVEAERPVFVTLAVLLVLLTDLGILVSGLTALVLVVAVTTLGRLRWIHEHSAEFPGHTG